jgi:hypothetical protein
VRSRREVCFRRRMRLDAQQLDEYSRQGWLVLDAPWPRALTEALRTAVDAVAVHPQVVRAAGGHKWTHHTLAPQMPGSYWCALDHSEDFMQVMLHPEIVELARQLEGTEDVFFRNGGINQLRPQRSVLWHHDYKMDVSALPDITTSGVEFMHYFGASGASRANGCLRLIPASHRLPDGQRYLNPRDPTRFDELLAAHRPAGAAADMVNGLVADVELPGEVSVELSPDQLLVRSNSIFHASWRNETAEGRLMHHWLYRPRVRDRPASEGNHRFRWGEYLTPRLLERLTDEQRQVLLLDESDSFEIDPAYNAEKDREGGVVRWGVREELPLGRQSAL